MTRKGRSFLGTPIDLLAHKRVTAKTVTQTRSRNMPCDISPPSFLQTTLSFLPSGVMSALRRHSCAGRNLNTMRYL